MKKKIAVGLSGGIDSSVAAFLLKKDGWEVVGVTLKFYSRDSRCCDHESLYQAQRLCQTLDIPHHVLDVKDVFEKDIIQKFINTYLSGFTPNPCVWCNRLVKFGWLMEKLRSWGIEYLATGHYARTIERDGQILFRQAVDEKKSQEYFLCLVDRGITANLVFPLGGYVKPRVKEVARENSLFFIDRPESQDVCFIKGEPYGKFIERHAGDVSKYSGQIRHVNGQVLGRHNGIYNFTCGQREGLGISWKEPLYVVAIDSESKSVVVGEKKFAFHKSFYVDHLNWFIDPKDLAGLKVRVRYNCPFYSCVIKMENDVALVFLDEEVFGIASGQIACLPG